MTARAIVPGPGDASLEEGVERLVGYAAGRLDDLTATLSNFQDFVGVDAAELVARQWRLQDVAAAMQRARDAVAKLSPPQQRKPLRELTEASARNQSAAAQWAARTRDRYRFEGHDKDIEILAQLLDAAPRDQGQYELLDLLVNLHAVLQRNRVVSIHTAFDPAVFKEVTQLAAGVERDHRLRRLVAEVVERGVKTGWALSEESLQQFGTSYDHHPPDYDDLARQLVAVAQQQAAVTEVLERPFTPEIVTHAVDARYASLVRASPRWRTVMERVAPRWRNKAGFPDPVIAHIRGMMDADDTLIRYAYDHLRNPTQTENQMFLDGIRWHLEGLARSGQHGLLSEIEVHKAIQAARPSQLVAAAKNPQAFLGPYFMTALTPAPWHALARAIAATASEGAVTVAVTTDAARRLDHVIWTSYGVDHPADEAVLTRLRAAGWPHEALRDFEYTTVIPQGTLGPAIGRLLATLSASTWAAAPIRTVPGGPGPPGTGAGPSAGLRAGMEEGEKADKPSGAGVSRREFLKSGAVLPHVAVQAVTGSSVVEAAATIAEARGTLLHAAQTLPFVKHVVGLSFPQAVIGTLRPVAETLLRVRALQTPGSTATSPWPTELSDAVAECRSAIQTWSVNERGWTGAPAPFLLKAAVEHPEHFAVAQTLAGLQWGLRDASVEFDADDVFTQLRQSGLLTGPEAPLQDSLKSLVAQRIQAFLTSDVSSDTGYRVPELQRMLLESGIAVDQLAETALVYARQITSGPRPDKREWAGGGAFESLLLPPRETFFKTQWARAMNAVREHWDTAGIPADVRRHLDRWLEYERSSFSLPRKEFVEEMELYGRLMKGFSKRGDLHIPSPGLVRAMTSEERMAAVADPSAWVDRMLQHTREQLSHATRALFSQLQQHRAQEEAAGVVREPGYWERLLGLGDSPVPRARPSPRALSRAEAEDVTLQLAARWGGRVRTYGRLPWSAPPAVSSEPLILYAPVSWGDVVMDRWTPGERETTVMRAIPAVTSGVPGVLLLDEAMPIPAAVAAMAPAAWPVILRIAREDLATVPYDYLAFLASQPALRGQVLLWAPAFATPVTLGDSPASYYLATEA